jgi:UDP-glucose 4-epimerase
MIGVIGGTGFIGLNLAFYLLKEKRPCRTFSRNGLLLHPESIYYPLLSGMEHVHGNFNDKAAVDRFVRSCDSVVLLVSHLLPSSGPEEIKGITPWFTAAFGQLLESCVAHRIEQIIFVSSGGTIYGENHTGKPVRESYPLNAQSAYGSFSALLEQMIHAFHREHDLRFTILRVGNPYGPLKRPNTNQGVIDHFIRCARANQPFTLFGDGTEIRDYIFVDDLSECIGCALSAPARNDIFNVGTGIGYNTREVIHLVRKHFELPEVPIILQDRRPGDVVCSLLNMDKFKMVYGKHCHSTLERGIKAYAAVESSNLGSQRRSPLIQAHLSP